MERNQYIPRQTYLDKLIVRRNNGEVKVIAGPRRCGKSWLLSHIYKYIRIISPPKMCRLKI